MKYLVHHGYYECNGLEIFNTEAQVRKFINRKRKKQRNPLGWFFHVYRVNDIERIKLESLV